MMMGLIDRYGPSENRLRINGLRRWERLLCGSNVGLSSFSVSVPIHGVGSHNQ